MSRPFVEPEIIEKGQVAGRWMVVIHNNDYNSFDEVVDVLMRATGCSGEEAAIETWEAHTYGKAPVHFSGRDECEIVAAMISSIGVRTEVRPEWED
jgi:ATP-dependent Clp protease adaptor protein ClpS